MDVTQNCDNHAAKMVQQIGQVIGPLDAVAHPSGGLSIEVGMKASAGFFDRDSPPAHEAIKHGFDSAGGVVRTTAIEILSQGIAAGHAAAATVVQASSAFPE